MEQPTKNYDSIGKFFGVLMHSRNVFHIKHLQSKSYAEHVALNELYDSLPGYIDDIVESYQGRCNCVISNYSFPIDNYEKKTALEYALLIRQYIDDNRKLLGIYSEIQNKVDELVGQFNSTIYKLINLK
jgi:hypothetical protein